MAGTRRPSTPNPPGTSNRARGDATLALTSTRANAVQLSQTLRRTAEALEQSARLAEQHFQRSRRRGRPREAIDERRAAERARRAAERARVRAAKLLDWID